MSGNEECSKGCLLMLGWDEDGVHITLNKVLMTAASEILHNSTK